MQQAQEGGGIRSARRASLRVLWLAIVGCVSLPLVLFASGAYTIRRSTHEEVDRRLARTADILHEHALKVLQTTEVLLWNLGEMTRTESASGIRTEHRRWHEVLSAITRGLPHVQSIWVIGPDGRVAATSYVRTLPSIDLSSRDYFAAHARSDGGTYIGSVLIPLLNQGAPFFSMSRRRSSPYGGFDGIATVSLLPAAFEKFYAELAAGSGSVLALHRADGARLARFPPAPPDVPPDAPPATWRPIVETLATGAERGLVTHVSGVDGQERRLAWRRLGPYPAFVVAGIETSAIRAEWVRALAGHLLFGVPVTLALVVALWVAMARTRALFDEAERRASAEEALQRAQRLEALGELTGGVAHDFNNLLMIVLGSVDRMRRRPREAGDIRSLDMIVTAVRRGEALTRQLLAFARRRALFPEPVDLAASLADMRTLLQHSLRGDIVLDVEAEGPPGAFIVRVDPSELELAILNIAVNARDAMPAGGRILMRLRRVELTEADGLEGLEGSFVALSLSDTGSGIPPDVLPRVFDPFFTTKDIGKGTGLGLSQVYGFARQSGGAAVIDSTPGEGTTVTLYLPHTDEQPMPRPPIVPAASEPGAGMRVLLVEDNAEVATVSRMRLEALGFDVTLAASARTALALLEVQGFSLVLSDILMPGGMSGIDLLHRLRERGIHVPVVLATGYSGAADRARSEGCIVLQKPYDDEQLREAVTVALASVPAPAEDRR